MNDVNDRLMIPLEAIFHLQRFKAVYASVPSDITPELVPLDGLQRHPPEHVTFPVDVVVFGAGVVVTGVAVGAGVFVTGVVVGAGVEVIDGAIVTDVVRPMDHEASNPSFCTSESVVNTTCIYPVFDV